MTELFALPNRAAVKRAMARLDGLARGLGLDETTARQIVEKVIVDMPERTDDERLEEARKRMLKA